MSKNERHNVKGKRVLNEITLTYERKIDLSMEEIPYRIGEIKIRISQMQYHINSLQAEISNSQRELEILQKLQSADAASKEDIKCQ